MTNAALQKLQSTQFSDNTGNGNLLLPGTATAVQGSVVAEPGISALSGSEVNTQGIRPAQQLHCTGFDCDCAGWLIRKHQFNV